jgi:hypothetical protein
MSNIYRKSKAGTQVSSWQQSSNTVTPTPQTSFILPYGLTLRQKVGQADITNVTASAGTVTYTAANSYSAGDNVSIYDVNPAAYNLGNMIITSASSTQFTVTNAATGTYISGGVAQKIGSVNVTIPAGITWVYAICVGGGGGAHNPFVAASGGGGGGITAGWTLASSTCVIGAGGITPSYSVTLPGGYTRYGHIIAGGGANGNSGGSGGIAGLLGSGGSGGAGGNQSGGAGGTSYYGVPGGTGAPPHITGFSSVGAGGGGGIAGTGILTAGAGGIGVSGGGGGSSNGTYSNFTGGAGGNGFTGGGGGGAQGGSGIVNTKGGDGGTGFNILTGAVTTGSSFAAVSGFGTYSNGGAGGGCAGNASGANGGLGGGGAGTNGVAGAGILYLFY